MSIDTMNTSFSDANLAWLADTCARLMLTHRIDRSLVAEALGIAASEVDRTLAGPAIEPDAELPERLALLVDILMRLEIRMRGDTRLLLETLATPPGTLEGRTPAETMTDIERLRAVREAIAAMPVPEIRMWRCPSGYA